MALVVEKPIGFSNYDERSVLKARFRKQLAQINEEMPIDLLVYTEEEYQSSLTEGGFIQKEVEEPGRVLYEEDS